jgi:hypothetical protein
MKFRKLTGRETGYRLHGEHRPRKVSALVEKGQHQFINPLELDLVNEQAFYVSSHSDLSSLNDFEVKRYKDKLDDVRADVMYMNRLKCYIVELHKAFGGALSFFGNLGLLRCHEDHFCEDGKINLPTIDNDMMEFTSKRGGIIHVYRPQDTYCLGWIAYGDYSKTKTGKNKYVLYSRHITNNKSIPENKIYNLLDTGHEFLSSVVEQRVRELRDVYKHYEEIRRKTYDMYAVRVYEDRHGVQRYSLHRIVNATDYEREIWELTDDDNRPMTFTNDNISKSLRGSLSVLSMLKVGDNVEDVGFRHDEDLYFIYINDEEKGNE